MMTQRLSREEFDAIYSKVPRLCVDAIIKTPKGIVLTKRTDPPAIDHWHIPGSTVLKGERLMDTFQRVLLEELRITENTPPTLVDIVEYDLSDEGYAGYPIGIAFFLEVQSEPTLGRDASAIGFFTKETLPEKILRGQRALIEPYL